MITVEKILNYGASKEVYENLFFKKDDLYISCFNIFLKNDKVMKFSKAIDERDYHEAFLNAHSLKGMIGNLGLLKMYEMINEILEDLRYDRFDDILNKKNMFMKEFELFLESVK